MSDVDMVAALTYLENRIQGDANADANIKELASATRALSEDLAELQRKVEDMERGLSQRFLK